MTLRAIWAQARGGVIGADGDMPWHLPEDLAHFKSATTGRPVVMGRRTWESFPARFRPLPGRENIVVTRNAEYDAPGAAVVGSLDEGIAAALAADPEPWIIGGGSIYAAAMDRLDELWVTEIDVDVDADTYAPPIGGEWLVSSCDPAEGWHLSREGIRYRFLFYTRTAP
ncbi:dihydrofolate reductase [Microbacterium sp. JB110]|uniref:dihydrofolate reductase n=1 Tax=Microbacterium sp. JB110 TaxID=2024477 RepID=UPI00097F0215|nr:dihydrofolate reductase [Microbacterium sp. JB110]RCS59095.1 dihydrofolate reductase [Microbacterium sp. JB110]SJM68752.1 Dihydrofolate reductase [Frigoribacterium sp. JB110]